MKWLSCSHRLSFGISVEVYLLPRLHKAFTYPFQMDKLKSTVSLDDFKLFHKVDRELYTILVMHLWRNPCECLQIMGLWLWLERVGLCSLTFIGKILSLPPFLINELADEAASCINFLNAGSPFPYEILEIPLTQSLMKEDISVQLFQEYLLSQYHKIETVITQVCFRAMSDLFEKSINGSLGQTSVPPQITMPFHGASSSSANQIRASPSSADSLLQNFSYSNIGDFSLPIQGTTSQANETFVHDRTMFLTFSKGYPVAEHEVRQFFTRLFGNCIESVYMQEVGPLEQSLYAKVVFLSPSFIDMILNGVPKAKFNINGKHVWMRKFVPRDAM